MKMKDCNCYFCSIEIKGIENYLNHLENVHGMWGLKMLLGKTIYIIVWNCEETTMVELRCYMVKGKAVEIVNELNYKRQELEKNNPDIPYGKFSIQELKLDDD